VTPYEIRFTREAQKDFDKLTPKLRERLREILLNTLSKTPYVGKRLIADLDGLYSFRLTYKDRIVYTIDEQTRRVIVHRTRTHYGE
jgi:mRNA-degrading endonuclease RelE of RelBE toxin-antitoxin system